MTDTGDTPIVVSDAIAIDLLRQIAEKSEELLLEALKDLPNGEGDCDCTTKERNLYYYIPDFVFPYIAGICLRCGGKIDCH